MKKLLGILLLGLVMAGCNKHDDQSAGSTAVGIAKPAPTFEWKMVTTWPPNFPIFQTGVEQFAKDIETMSNGRLKIQVFAGGELVPPLQTFDAVSSGTVQMGHGGAYYWAGKIPAAQFFTSVPFGMNAQGMNSWLYFGGGLELWREAYAPHNLVPFPMGNTGVQMGGWFNKKINTIDDLKGLKMRLPGLGGKVLAKAGGNPVLMAGGEIYTALDRGVIDATEWVGPYHDERLGLYRAAKYYYYPGWHEPGSVMELIVNKQAWESLPPDLKKIVEKAADSTNVRMLAEFESKNLDALKKLKKDGVQVLEFPPQVLHELKRLSGEVFEEESAKDAEFKKVYAAFKAFQQKNEQWNDISESAYARALKD